MPDLTGIKPGDTVLVFTQGRTSIEPRETTVAKVGRTLVHVPDRYDGARLLAFRLDTGHRADGYGVTYLLTPALVAEREERRVAEERLEGLGIRVEVRRPNGVIPTPAALQAIADVIERDR